MEPLTPGMRRVAATDVIVQGHQRQMHHHDAAVAMHDRFGQAGGAAGIHDPQRMVEGQVQRLKVARVRVVAGKCIGKVDGIESTRPRRGQGPQAVMDDQVHNRRQGGTQFGHHPQAVLVATAVRDTITGNQHPWPDLAKAVQHSVAAHVGRAQAPHCADAGTGQEGHDGLGPVGQVSRHPVARLHTHLLQGQGQRGGLAAQLRPAQRARLPKGKALLGVAEHGWHASRMRRLHMPENLPCVVDLRTGKPDRTGHAPLGQHGCVGRRRVNKKVVPDALPEGIEVGDRPVQQGIVGRKNQAPVHRQPILVAPDLGKRM